MLLALVFGGSAAAGIALAAASGPLARARPRNNGRSGSSSRAGSRKPAAGGRRLSPLVLVQAAAAVGGGLVGWVATGLLGMALLLGGLGALLPPFMAAPARRRRQIGGVMGLGERLVAQMFVEQLRDQLGGGAPAPAMGHVDGALHAACSRKRP